MAKYRGKNNYMGAWSYVLLDILYAIPVIGLICLLVHSFSGSNENRLHYARSYFARFLLALILIAALVGVLYLTVGPEGMMDYVETVQTQIEPFINNTFSF